MYSFYTCIYLKQFFFITQAIFYPLMEHLREHPSTAESCDKKTEDPRTSITPTKTGVFKGAIVKAFRKALMMEPGSSSVDSTPVKFTSDITIRVAESCQMFSNIINTFSM